MNDNDYLLAIEEHPILDPNYREAVIETIRYWLNEPEIFYEKVDTIVDLIRKHLIQPVQEFSTYYRGQNCIADLTLSFLMLQRMFELDEPNESLVDDANNAWEAFQQTIGAVYLDLYSKDTSSLDYRLYNLETGIQSAIKENRQANNKIEKLEPLAEHGKKFKKGGKKGGDILSKYLEGVFLKLKDNLKKVPTNRQVWENISIDTSIPGLEIQEYVEDEDFFYYLKNGLERKLTYDNLKDRMKRIRKKHLTQK